MCGVPAAKYLLFVLLICLSGCERQQLSAVDQARAFQAELKLSREKCAACPNWNARSPETQAAAALQKEIPGMWRVSEFVIADAGKTPQYAEDLARKVALHTRLKTELENAQVSGQSEYGGLACVGVVLVLFFGGIFLFFRAKDEARAIAKADAERRLEGDPKIVCPHCQERGHVTTCYVEERAGIDGGKATAALLTGGISMLATGLSNQIGKTQATCANCGSIWRF